MRKDVRLGLAVGGLLFGAVLIYALFFAGDRKAGDSQGQQAAAESTLGGADSSAGKGEPAKSEPAKKEAAPAPRVTISSPAPAATTTEKPAAIAADATPSAANTASTPAESTSSGSVAVDSGGPTPPASSSYNTPSAVGQVDWNKVLSTGVLPAVTETPSGGRETTASRDMARTTERAARSPSESTSSPTPKTYIVKPGETYWTIAKSVYGDVSFWNHLQRANPKVTPKGLRAGMTINLPSREEVVPAGSTALISNAAKAGAAIDSNRQYRVRSGDNLNTICQRLYGSIEKVDSLYQLNKAVIGPNPSALKTNMVLELPSPPTKAQAALAGTENN